MNQTQILSLTLIAAASSGLLYFFNRKSSGGIENYRLDNFPDPFNNGSFDMAKVLDNVATPKGIRNNNPGNIEDNGTPWRGRIGDDGRFIIFDKPENGIRAIARTLDTYSNKYGINTLDRILSRWAPPSENNTEAYIRHAEKALKISRHTPIGYQHKAALIKVIIKHENGQQPYSDKVINDGIAAA